MTPQEKIQEQVSRIYRNPDPDIRRGNDHDSAGQARHGWWYRPVDSNPIFLGASLAEALERLDLVDSRTRRR